MVTAKYFAVSNYIFEFTFLSENNPKQQKSTHVTFIIVKDRKKEKKEEGEGKNEREEEKNLNVKLSRNW